MPPVPKHEEVYTLQSKTEQQQQRLTVLLLFYNYMDKNGDVNVDAAADFALKHKGIVVLKQPFKITQRHVDLLIMNGLLPDTTSLLQKFMLPK